ncbi:hypothetical protein [Streptomyces sp. NPDC002990]
MGPFRTVEAVLDHLRTVAAAKAVEDRPSPAFLTLVRGELAALHEGGGTGGA